MAISMEEENYTCPDKIAYQIVCETSNSRACATPICWEQITLRFNSSRGTHISEGVARDICSGGTENQGEHISPLHRPIR